MTESKTEFLAKMLSKLAQRGIIKELYAQTDCRNTGKVKVQNARGNEKE